MPYDALKLTSNHFRKGADLVAKWYESNIHIFANLQRVANRVTGSS